METERKKHTLGSKKNIIYEENCSFRDNITGEVTNTRNRVLRKVEKTPDFIMLFTEHVAFLENLNTGEKGVLAQILQNFVGIRNIVLLSSGTKQDMAKALGVGISSIQKATKSLLDKQILIKGIIKENQIYLNPHLFGKGNWENIHKLRQEVAYDFDFEKLEMKESRRLATQYEDESELHDTEIISAEEYRDEKGVLVQDIHIQDKDKSPVAAATDNNSGLMILNAQNESKKLAIEEMQLKIKMKEMGIL
ncbi:MAG: replication/maintenance protein RepL [Sulfurimonas sp.]|uniref:replication/maintenance protein RepL n=1 Tax=Sulfurimonas sp. TaxID=2022749 RepID=UPI002615AE72|nr:replication/maintenance protein RepL [Sulfurimonas sp.]MDD5373292.1 replication/maintenance protein RepL [Sulfurimonas sp.]